MLDASTVFRCARVCSTYWSDATHPHTLDATPLSRHATLPQVPTYGVHERSEHGGLERVQRTFRTGCVRCSQHLRVGERAEQPSLRTIPPTALLGYGANRSYLTLEHFDRKASAALDVGAELGFGWAIFILAELSPVIFLCRSKSLLGPVASLKRPESNCRPWV